MIDGVLTNRIRTLRFLQGEMSQTELGQRIGVTRQTVAAMESGKYSPSLEAAFRIAHVFGADLEDVFQWKPAGAVPRPRPDAAGDPSQGHQGPRPNA